MKLSQILLEKSYKITFSRNPVPVFKQINNGTKFTGITKILKKIFYDKHSNNYIPNKKYHKNIKNVRGIKGGCKIHTQLQDYYARGVRQNIDSRTKSIINWLKKSELKVLYTEYPVGDEKKRIATAIDLLCIDKKDNILLLEIKTGYDANYTSKTKYNMRHPMNELNQSYWSQHQLQMLASRELFISHTGIIPSKCLLIRVDSNIQPNKKNHNIHMYPLLPVLHNKGPILLKEMHKYLMKKN